MALFPPGPIVCSCWARPPSSATTMKAITSTVRDGGLHRTRMPPGRAATRTLVTWYWACWPGNAGLAAGVARAAGDGLPGCALVAATTPHTKPASRATAPAPSSRTSQVRRAPGTGPGAAPGVTGCTGGKWATRRSFPVPSVSPLRVHDPGGLQDGMINLEEEDAWLPTRSVLTGARP